MCLTERSSSCVVIGVKIIIFGLISLATVISGSGDRLCGLYLRIGDIRGPPANATIFISVRRGVTLGPVHFPVEANGTVLAQLNSSLYANDDLCYMQIFWRPTKSGIRNWYLEQVRLEVCSGTGATRNSTFVFNLWPDANKWLIAQISLPGIWTEWFDSDQCLPLSHESTDATYKQLYRTCVNSPSAECPHARPSCAGNNTKLTAEICTGNQSVNIGSRDRMCMMYLFTSFLNQANQSGYIHVSLRTNEAIGPLYLSFQHGSVVSVPLTPAIVDSGPWCYVQLYWQPAYKANPQWHLGKVLLESCVDTDRRRNNTYILNDLVESNTWITMNISIGGEWSWSDWSSCPNPHGTPRDWRQRSLTCDSVWGYCPNARRHCTGNSMTQSEPCTFSTTTTATATTTTPTTTTPTYKENITKTEMQNTMSTAMSTADKDIRTSTKITTEKTLVNLLSMAESATTDYGTDTDTTSVHSTSSHGEKTDGGDKIDVYADDKTDKVDDNTADDEDDAGPIALSVVIALGVVGGALLIAMVVFGCIFIFHKRKRRTHIVHQDDKDTISSSSEYSSKAETEHYYSILDLTSDFEDASLNKY